MHSSFHLQACLRSSTITKYLAPTPPLNNNNKTPHTHTQKKWGGGGGIHIYTALILSCAHSEQTTFISGRKCYNSVKTKKQRNNKKSGKWITAEDEQLKHYANLCPFRPHRLFRQESKYDDSREETQQRPDNNNT